MLRVTSNEHNPHPSNGIAGFPGSQPVAHQFGTSETFEQARNDFADAWRDYLAKCTEADFQAWRDQRDRTESKYAMWERGGKLPSQIPKLIDGMPAA